MSTKDDALIEKMGKTYWEHLYPEGDDEDDELEHCRTQMRAVLAVARKAILEDAEMAILDKTAKLYAHAKAPYLECADVVRSLIEQEKRHDA